MEGPACQQAGTTPSLDWPKAVTKLIPGSETAARIRAAVPDIELEEAADWVVVDAPHLAAVAAFLCDDPALDCRYPTAITAVDRLDHFELVYYLSSLQRNHMVILKTRAPDHEAPEVPSVVPVWYGAHLQEREIYDLMGIRFSGHPSLKRIFLWEGFAGHPLRKDFLTLPGGQKPGLAHFPKE
jgi:NADH-quinone oxidoreductase subunit C